MRRFLTPSAASIVLALTGAPSLGSAEQPAPAQAEPPDKATAPAAGEAAPAAPPAPTKPSPEARGAGLPAAAEGRAPGQDLPPDKARALYQMLAREKNECPDGIPGLIGTWRFTGDSKAENFQDEIAFQGTDFTEWLTEGPKEAPRKAIVEGSYACVYRNRILFQIRKVEPEGAFDNKAGDAYPCDVLSPIESEESAKVLLICFFDWKLDVASGKEFEYERVGD